MKFARRKSRCLMVGGVPVGGTSPIAVQSMNNLPATDVQGNLAQIERLASAGCAFSRLAVPDEDSLLALAQICRASKLPLVADIHFDHRLALGALNCGVSALRINPGNIRDRKGIEEIARAARLRKVPIRVGVNSGSLSAEIRKRFGGVNAKALTASCLEACELLENCDFEDICLSIKSSDPLLTIETYRLISDRRDYPLHLGVTEAGTMKEGLIRSAVGIGTLLAEGIGDTIRVSLTAEPEEEVKAAYAILKSLNLSNRGAQLISCPTCGRTAVDLISLAERVETLLSEVEEPIKVAVMGCVVNGPGEAREADCGIAGARGEYIVFRRGEILARLSELDAFEALKAEIEIAKATWRSKNSVSDDAT